MANYDQQTGYNKIISCSPRNSTLACNAETPKAPEFWNTQKEPNVCNCHISRSIGGRLLGQKKVDGIRVLFYIQYNQFS